MKRLIIIVLILQLCADGFPTRAQQTLAIGSKAPSLVLNVYDGKSTKNPVAVSRQIPYGNGRWLVLDFWSKTCKLCIQGMPKVDRLAKTFAGKIDFLLIGTNEGKYNQGIEQMYQRLARQLGLQLDYAFDGPSHLMYAAQGYPHVVIIDPQGNIAAITYGSELEPDKLNALLSGKPGAMEPKTGFTTVQAIPSDTLQQLVVDNGPLARKSVLLRYRPTQVPRQNLDLARYAKAGRYEVSGVHLERLYLIAYFGRGIWSMSDSLHSGTWPSALLEVADPAPFRTKTIRGTNLYAYQLKLKNPNADAALFQAAMQRDLSQWFGYRASLEYRQMPTLALRWTGDRLPPKSSSARQLSDDPGLLHYRGAKIGDLVQELKNFHPRIYFEDFTGIDYPIDLYIEGPISNLEKFSGALRAAGMELVPSQKRLKVLVIADP